MGSAVSIARNLGARRQGHDWRCPCPCGCGYGLSLATGEDGKLLAHCFGGCDYNDVLTALVEYGLLDDGDGDHVHDDVLPCEPVPDSARIAHALKIYCEASGGSLVATYLGECRGISLLPPPVLREHLHCPHRLRIRLPAMLAPIVDIAGEQTGVHMTYLKHDGRGKAALPEEFQRECRGVIRGGTIRLAEYDSCRELLVGEGLESTLAAMELYGRPGWSSIYADNLKDTLELPETIRNIVIAADNDVNGTGQRAAFSAYRRWSTEGRSVEIVMPPDTGTDFNDLLMAEG